MAKYGAESTRSDWCVHFCLSLYAMTDSIIELKTLAPVTHMFCRKDRIDFSPKPVKHQLCNKWKKAAPQMPSGVSGGMTRKKPTLICHLGGTGVPKGEYYLTAKEELLSLSPDSRG